MMDGGMMDGMTGWGLAGGIIGMVFMLALLTMVVLGIIWLVRSLTRSTSSSRPSALEDLDRRYARGEFTREEYQQRRADIQDHQPPE